MLRSEKDAWSTIKWPRQLTKKRVRFPPPSPLGFAYLSTKQVIGLSGSTGQTTLVYAERSTPVCSSTSSGVKRQLHPARSTRKNQTSGKKARGNQLIFSRKIVGTNEGTTLSVSRGGKKVVRWDKQRARNNPGGKPLAFFFFFFASRKLVHANTRWRWEERSVLQQKNKSGKKQKRCLFIQRQSHFKKTLAGALSVVTNTEYVFLDARAAGHFCSCR